MNMDSQKIDRKGFLAWLGSITAALMLWQGGGAKVDGESRGVTQRAGARPTFTLVRKEPRAVPRRASGRDTVLRA